MKQTFYFVQILATGCVKVGKNVRLQPHPRTFFGSCFPTITSYKHVIVVFREFVVKARNFCTSSVKSVVFHLQGDAVTLERITWNKLWDK